MCFTLHYLWNKHTQLFAETVVFELLDCHYFREIVVYVCTHDVCVGFIFTLFMEDLTILFMERLYTDFTHKNSLKKFPIPI
jgi:hypothetical protein